MSLGVREARKKTELVELHVKEMEKVQNERFCYCIRKRDKEVAASRTLK